MSNELDQVMERASRELTDMDYLACEAACLEGLAIARESEDWTGYARVLMPLQECRRQRRMIAADAGVQLGTNACWNDPRNGCVAVTHPLDAAAAQDIVRQAAEQRRHAEVLWCDNPADAETWTVRTFTGADVACEVPAPPADAINQRLTPDDSHGQAAAHWFIAASEALGDAALSAVEAPLGSAARLEQLEAMVAAVGDHEILHQRLGDAARALADTQPAPGISPGR